MQRDRIPACHVQSYACIAGENGVVGALALTTEREFKMKMTLFGCCATLFVLSLPGVLATAQAAESEEVTVDGPYTINEQQEPWIGPRRGELTIIVSQRVNFSDLDFSKQADLDKLRDRLKTAARDSCLELERRYPSGTYALDKSRVQCIREANQEGYIQAMANLQAKAEAQRGAMAKASIDSPPQAR